jgi:hypothetical protein
MPAAATSQLDSIGQLLAAAPSSHWQLGQCFHWLDDGLVVQAGQAVHPDQLEIGCAAVRLTARPSLLLLLLLLSCCC